MQKNIKVDTGAPLPLKIKNTHQQHISSFLIQQFTHSYRLIIYLTYLFAAVFVILNNISNEENIKCLLRTLIGIQLDKALTNYVEGFIE
ncbi:hypothetical protein FF38_02777 [Lucilia cuprina]|uniref:Uncharacterized protein n=1 Tax=Lucilia cuprina TaxID=7375 RepID=A0A0L0CQQ6_LUCCU|nr:hypothetical protein FF38_02777 [Lucilia cuprina]